MSIALLIERQNRDGGWPYIRGASWTEPTAYAILALLAAGEPAPAERGLRWMRAAQRRDGGWPPQPGVEQSTWVTALAALLPPERLGREEHRRSIEWLLGAGGAETSIGYRMREWLLGNAPPADQAHTGWPWMPGTAAWVGPTSLAILALEKEALRRPSSATRERIDSGRRFLLSRVCTEGGWNHGSVRAMGYTLPPYPETTGMALAALGGVESSQMERSIEIAVRFLAECRSADALSWLRLGLITHKRLPKGNGAASALVCRTLSETSLALLTGEAAEGKGPFRC
jgi:squalene cyclase